MSVLNFFCIIMEKPNLKVEEVRTQYSIKNLLGRSVRLDIHVIDSVGRSIILKYREQIKVRL